MESSPEVQPIGDGRAHDGPEAAAADGGCGEAHEYPFKSEDGVGRSAADTEEMSAFEFTLEDGKDLLSLNEELSHILDPKVDEVYYGRSVTKVCKRHNHVHKYKDLAIFLC